MFDGATALGPCLITRRVIGEQLWRVVVIELFASLSVIPIFVGLAPFMFCLSFYLMVRMNRVIGKSAFVASVAGLPDNDFESCGVVFRDPARLSVSYPMGKVIVRDDFIYVRTPVGEWSFRRDDGARIASISNGFRFEKFEVQTSSLRAILYLNRTSSLRDNLRGHGWDS